MGVVTRARLLGRLVQRGEWTRLYHAVSAGIERAREPSVPKGPPIFLQVEPTILCNLECAFCINPYLPRARATLTLNKFCEMLDQVPSVSKISLVGIGESVINKELWQMIRYAKSKGIEIGTTSNGTILTDAMVKEICDSGLDWLNFSIDGATKATYEKMRPGATFEQLLENIKRVVNAIDGRRVPALSVWFLATRDNIAELPDMVPLVKNLGIRSLNTQGVHYWGNEDWHEGARAANDIPNLISILQTTRDCAEDQGVRFAFHNFPDPNAERACKWPWTGSYITADGFVTPCCENGSDPDKINFGNIFTTPFDKIWYGDAYREFREQLRSTDGRPPICIDCPSYHQKISLE